MTHNDNGLDPRTGTTGDPARKANAFAQSTGRTTTTGNRTEMNTMNHTAPRTADRPQATTLRRVPLLLALCLVGLGLHRSVVNRAGVRGMLFGAALWAVSIVTGYVLATIG